MVLALPQGTLQAETLWTVHDPVRYLWMLNNGHFLVRDRNNLFVGDATLALKPFLDFPGPLLWVELDPSQRFIVTSSREPETEPRKPGLAGSGIGVDSPSTASASITSDEDSAATESQHPEIVVRILRRQSGEVMLVSRAHAAVHLPINSIGYLENLRSRGAQWDAQPQLFHRRQQDAGQCGLRLRAR